MVAGRLVSLPTMDHREVLHIEPLSVLGHALVYLSSSSCSIIVYYKYNRVLGTGVIFSYTGTSSASSN